MNNSSGVQFSIDATECSSRYLHVRISIAPPFTDKKLILKFPRWVPGSYFIREPMQYLTGLNCLQQGNSIHFKRKAVDSVEVKLADLNSEVIIDYRILGIELSVRSTHIDESHLHMMPPFTFLLPTSGIEKSRMEMNHKITLFSPSDWIPATQLTPINNRTNIESMVGNTANQFDFMAPNRDELLDGIIESNANPNLSHIVDGRKHILKLWDSGGNEVEQEMIERFIADMEKIIKEHHALFGIPNWGDYITIIHLTEKSRGGLEHLNSQTSMLPRACLIDGYEDEYRDLISLFSHEYLHQWNVKRLRPSNFIEYDLQHEVHTELLWWFEGCTSWLGDMLCVRSGAWSEADWRKDMERKLNRHKTRHGSEHESLAEASHDAWIHLYRSNAFSRETQISYYLEAELAIFCLDVELKKRSRGEHGICDLMAKLCEKYALGYPNIVKLGVEYRDIRKELVNMKGGRNLGVYLDRMVYDRTAPNVKDALEFYGLNLVAQIDKEKSFSTAWLGLNLADKGGKVIVNSHQGGSTLRNVIMPGDEIISLNCIRINSTASLKKLLSKLNPSNVELCYTHEGVVKSKVVDLTNQPELENKLSGKGNIRWQRYIESRTT